MKKGKIAPFKKDSLDGKLYSYRVTSKTGGEKLIYDFISPGALAFRLFLYSIRPRLLALFIQLAQLWGLGGNENGNHFLIWADTCWKKEDFQNRRLLYFLLCGGYILTFRFVDLSPRAQEVRYIGKLKEACQIKSIRLFCWIAVGQGSGFSSRNGSGKPIQFHWPSKPN